ncbi:MAG: TIGR01212 family radical SAM protein [Lentimicrobiaceae bacterium]|nr:TIGR01212 family radical SAM protein [Lentimicrobiaceae bacterium]
MSKTERYYSFTKFLRERFGARVQKLAIDAGFTCPNRDGSKSYGGCTYCNNSAFNPSYCTPEKSIAQQIEEGIEFHKRRYRRAVGYLAYFQAFSNTYAPLNELKQKYAQALQNEQVLGIVIGTRPDCVDDEKLDYLSELNKTHFVSIEYGIESCYNQTLEKINRCHSFEDTQLAIVKTAERGIHVGGHIIFGLPGETEEMMMQEAEILSQLPLNSIKFHQLQIFKNTPMAQMFKDNPSEFKLFELQQYISFIVGFCEKLRPDIAIERFSSEAPPSFLVNSPWSNLRTDQILNLIKKEFVVRDTYQGVYFN